MATPLQLQDFEWSPETDTACLILGLTTHSSPKERQGL